MIQIEHMIFQMGWFNHRLSTQRLTSSQVFSRSQARQREREVFSIVSWATEKPWLFRVYSGIIYADYI